jgi:hypothetical protein
MKKISLTGQRCLSTGWRGFSKKESDVNRGQN